MWIINLVKNIVFQTVISGVLVYVFGQMIQRFILEPIFSYRATIAKIDNKLKFYGDITGNPGSGLVSLETILECSKSIRGLSCELESNFKQLPFQFLFAKCKSKVADSAKSLIRLSNSLGASSSDERIRRGEKNYEDAQTIRTNLGIDEL